MSDKKLDLQALKREAEDKKQKEILNASTAMSMGDIKEKLIAEEEKLLGGEYLTDFVDPRYSEAEQSEITKMIGEGTLQKQPQLYNGRLYLVNKVDHGRTVKLDAGQRALAANTPRIVGGQLVYNQIQNQT